MKQLFAALLPLMAKHMTRRRKVALAALGGVSLLTFGFFAVTRPAAQDVPPVSPADSLAADTLVADSLKAADSLAIAQDSVAADGAAGDSSVASSVKYRAGEDPAFAEKMGWPVDAPAPLPGAIVPAKRIVAYYGNPLSKRMGALGEYEPRDMLARLERQADEWRKADPATPVQPALHLIVVVAQGDPGPSGKYRTIMRDTMIEMVHGWAKSKNAIMFLDIQTGLSDIRELLPKFEKFLVRPDVHLAIDPEFMMKDGSKPGTRVGTMDAADINYASSYLSELVSKHNLPPKTLIIHRFKQKMVTNYQNVKLRPDVQIVMHMDGWGAPWLKRDSYKDYIVREPVQYTGFKLFYHNDTKKGDPLMSPTEVLKLNPKPIYIQYQ
jgi:hypothetical protein